MAVDLMTSNSETSKDINAAAVQVLSVSNTDVTSIVYLEIDITSRTASEDATILVDITTGSVSAGFLEELVESGYTAIRLQYAPFIWHDGETLTVTVESNSSDDSSVDITARVFSESPSLDKTFKSGESFETTSAYDSPKTVTQTKV